MINLKECYAHEVYRGDTVCVMGELWKVMKIEDAEFGFNMRLDSLNCRKSTWVHYTDHALVKVIVDERIK